MKIIKKIKVKIKVLNWKYQNNLGSKVKLREASNPMQAEAKEDKIYPNLMF